MRQSYHCRGNMSRIHHGQLCLVSGCLRRRKASNSRRISQQSVIEANLSDRDNLRSVWGHRNCSRDNRREMFSGQTKRMFDVKRREKKSQTHNDNFSNSLLKDLLHNLSSFFKFISCSLSFLFKHRESRRVSLWKSRKCASRDSIVNDVRNDFRISKSFWVFAI